MSKAHTQNNTEFLYSRMPQAVQVTVVVDKSTAMVFYYPKETQCIQALERAKQDFRAVNSHEALVSALEQITNLPDGGRGYGDQAVVIARAALKLAKADQ